MGKIILVLGGTKTGKTRFAQGIAQNRALQGRGVGYIATARAWDDEMARRIQRHKEDRPSSWLTIEEPLDMVAALQEGQQKCDILLLDCLTLLMTNWLMELQGESESLPPSDVAEEYFHQAVSRMIEGVTSWPGELVIISNLVENGLVSTYPFTRLFQDLAGMTHQQIAAKAETVVQMTAGLPLYLKGGPVL